jgi:hypothetical protein
MANWLISNTAIQDAGMNKRPSLAKSLTQSVEQAARPNSVEPEPTVAEEPTKVTPAGYRAATRVGKKKVTVPLEPEAHKSLRLLAIDKNTTAEALLLEAVRDLFAKYGRPPIA